MPSTESTFSAEAPASPAGASILYKPANWFEPLDWRAVFAQRRPLEIDLGCGRGTFLLWAARTYPQRNFLGVERLLRRLRRVDRKAVRAGLDNVRLIRIEATYLIVKLVPDGSVSTYHILFPDPWPKRRHQSRRLICAPLLGEVHRTLTAGGVVNCATDHEEYFEWIQREFRKTDQFEGQEPPVLPPEAWTEFEREFVAAGKKVYRCRWQKR
ncbi:MAG TPA: tRNA (guanosine(46)-N7)-methyltransferase TrmB [Verrucomicrobiae bacterium]|nr:tRNA (guanosine(46)-N7)-methyltransferase TrmB [Verrucomicrobiae bacterium]